MYPRNAILSGFATGAFLLNPSTALAAEAPAVASKRPNVVVILSDDLGYQDTGVYGCKDIPTPNIDALARNGVRFTQGYMTCPVCSPSRAGLLTGRYQQRYGFEFLCNEASPMKPGAKMGIAVGEKTVGDRMRALGYKTGLLGKWHVGFDGEFLPPERGFDEFYGDAGQPAYFIPPRYDTQNPGKTPGSVRKPQKGYYVTDDLTARAADFIRRHKDEPFFLYIGHKAVHTPFEVTDKYLSRFPADKFQKENRRRHAAMASALDDSVGGVMRALRENGLEENTLVIFSSDNGGSASVARNDPLRGGKGSTWEGGIRVPFIMQWKGTLTPGTTYDRPVSALDILPTSVAVAGGKPPSDWNLDGVDLLPYLKGENAASPHEALYWRFGNQWAVRKGDWKLVQGREGKDGKTNIQVAVVGEPRLYNLAEDIGETRDLAADHPETVKELRALYDKWNAQLMDPLWTPAPNADGSKE